MSRRIFVPHIKIETEAQNIRLLCPISEHH